MYFCGLKRVFAGILVLVSVMSVAPCRPISAASKHEQRGQELFATKGCPRCHGPNGVGGGKGPDLQLVRKRRNRKSMVDQIRNGGMQMPAFGTALSQQEIDDLVSFLRAKRKVIVPATPKSEQSTRDAEQPRSN